MSTAYPRYESGVIGESGIWILPLWGKHAESRWHLGNLFTSAPELPSFRSEGSKPLLLICPLVCGTEAHEIKTPASGHRWSLKIGTFSFWRREETLTPSTHFMLLKISPAFPWHLILFSWYYLCCLFSNILRNSTTMGYFCKTILDYLKENILFDLNLPY